MFACARLAACKTLSVFGIGRWDNWGNEGLREAKREGLGKTNEGKTERAGREGGREGSGRSPDASQLLEKERQSSPVPFAAGVDLPLTHRHTPSQTPIHICLKTYFSFYLLSAPFLPTYVCAHW